MKIIMEGAISVKAALTSKFRTVHTIYMDADKRSRDFAYILRVADQQGVAVKRVKRSWLDEAAQGNSHGGLLAEVSPRTYQTLEQLDRSGPLFLALLEGIEDPYNFGYALRTLYAFGCHGCLVPSRNWSTEDAIVCKSSAGASDALPLIVCDEFTTPLQQLKREGVAIFCAMRKDALPLTEVSYQASCLIAVGGPLRGLSRAVLDQSDQNVYIPYANDFRNALNAGSAISVFSYEIYRQRSGSMIK